MLIMHINIVLVTYTLVNCIAGQGVLRQPLTRSFITSKSPRGFGLSTTMIVDGQKMEAVVDTGSSYLIWVWKTHYEKSAGRGACDKLFFKCYECLWPCKPAEPTIIQYGGVTHFEVFKHSGTVSLGNAILNDIDFGLISSFSPSQNSPYALLGMSPDVDRKYPSLLKQLVERFPSPLKENVFAIYLKPGRSGTTEGRGELILGGGDRSLYKQPLQFVPTISDDSWRVGFSAVEFGKHRLVVADKVYLDTGSNYTISRPSLEMVYIYSPQAKLNELLRNIEQAASDSAKKKVTIEYEAQSGVWEVECKYRKYMPTLNFMLSTPSGDVPLSIPYKSYVPVAGKFCYLFISTSQTDLWQLPDFMLIGNYLEFQPDKKRVGIAKLK